MREAPEVAVTAAFVTLEPTSRCVWILVSPSEQHVSHWAVAVGLALVRCTSIVVLDIGVT